MGIFLIVLGFCVLSFTFGRLSRFGLMTPMHKGAIEHKIAKNRPMMHQKMMRKQQVQNKRQMRGPKQVAPSQVTPSVTPAQ